MVGMWYYKVVPGVYKVVPGVYKVVPGVYNVYTKIEFNVVKRGGSLRLR